MVEAPASGEEQRVRARALMEGRVQGVGYRAAARRTALRYGLTGWVRNLPDGRVEALIEGRRDEVENLIRWCRQGPAGAQVTLVKVHWEAPTGEFEDFFISG